MGGVYNKFEEDGITIDRKRRVDVFAVDFNTTLNKTETYLVGELVFNLVDVPGTYTQQYGDKQYGFFIDIVQPILIKIGNCAAVAVILFPVLVVGFFSRKITILIT